jgi:hypothetical protein
MSLIHRAVTALVSSALAVSLVAAGEPARAAVAPSSPSGHGATWLAGQLNAEGLIHNSDFGFDDYGLTIDTAFALASLGGHQSAVDAARKALAGSVDSYTTGKDFGLPDVYASATAKLLVAAERLGGNERSFGGTNLVSRLQKLVITTGPAKGRIQDKSDTDFANTLGQAYAVEGLTVTGSDLAKPTLSFLLAQQCSKGYFRLDFATSKTKAQSCDAGSAKSSAPDTDATASVVLALTALDSSKPAVKTSIASALRWLKQHQGGNGSFGGSRTTAAANTNSTGLAGWALGVNGVCGRAAKAASWIKKRQLEGSQLTSALKGERGAIAYDGKALKAAGNDGITVKTRDQWRRATAQAAPALAYLSTTGCQAR